MYYRIEVLYACAPPLDYASKREVYVATKLVILQWANPVQCPRPLTSAARVIEQSKIGAIRYNTVQRSIAHVCSPPNWLESISTAEPTPDPNNEGLKTTPHYPVQGDSWTQTPCASQSEAKGSDI